jgi:TrmH family RNA methyltransferase
MEKITSVTNDKIKSLLNLRKKYVRHEEQKFLVEGLHLSEEAYKNNLLEVVLSTDELLLQRFSNVKQILVSDAVINKLSTTTSPQNIIGVVKMKKQESFNSNKYVVLDDINDPGNFGTIIRTSLALGVKDIIVSTNTVDEYNEKTLRATQGAIFRANIIRMNLEEAYAKFKKDNIKIITTSLDTKQELKDLNKPESFAVVLGNEARGISEISKNYSDESIIIPLQNDIESLNVAIAFSIVLYNLTN